jgi:hypothetical protein
MCNKLAYCFSKTLLFFITLVVINNAFAFGDNDLEQIKNRLSIKIAPKQLPPQTGGLNGQAVITSPAKELSISPTQASPRDEMLNSLDASYLETLEKCEGRFDLLAQKNERQIKRSEWIAIAGGTLGVIGTIATCPHCAAAMSGFAGLANPLQASLSQNNDTPQTTQARLSVLANKISEEYDNYKKLPSPNPSDANKEFYAAYRAKVEQLLSIASSCSIYSKTYTAINSGQQSGGQTNP